MPRFHRRSLYTTAPLSTVDVDLIVVPWFEDERPRRSPALDRAAGGELARALASKEFAARLFDQFVAPVVDRSWKARRVLLVGAGPHAGFDTATARRVATAAALAARQRRVGRAAFPLRPGLADPAGDIDVAGFAQAVAEGLTLAEFNVGSLQDRRPAARPFRDSRSCCPTAPTHRPKACRASRRAHARPAARRMQQPGARARQRAGQHADAARVRGAGRRHRVAEGGAAVEILDEHQIEALGMGLLLGVARGSSEPPRLMVFRHDRRARRPGPVLGLVGKGITFDTGGISIKPADGMERMKDDMAGGAAVACAMRAIAHARRADPRRRRRAGDREHAGRPRHQAGRHPARARKARPSR